MTLGTIAQRLILDPALTLRVLQQLAEWVHQREGALRVGVEGSGNWTWGRIHIDDLAPMVRKAGPESDDEGELKASEPHPFPSWMILGPNVDKTPAPQGLKHPDGTHSVKFYS